MTREEAIELAIKACKETWNEKTCKQIREVLEQEPCNTDTCKVVKAYMNEWDKPNNFDAISRQAVLDLIEHYNSDGLGALFYGYDEGLKFTNAVNKLPPVTPQPKMGYWLINKEKSLAKCSNCKFLLKDKDEIKLFGTFMQGYNYCPNCGCKMERDG